MTEREKKAENAEETPIFSRKLSIENENQVVFNLHSEIEKIIINSFLSDLRQYLRKKLKNGKIEIQFTLIDKPSETLIYTDKEKLNFMMKKNPKFKNFFDRLGLDYEF